MPELGFAEGLGLPEKIAGAQTYGFIARKGGGKSYAASKLAELLHMIGVPLIAIDPKGDWWGLRVSADGTGRGLSIPVIGGLHGDLELDTDAAERLARYLVETKSSAVLDVSQLRKGQRSQFVAVFLESLFAAVKAQRVRRQRMIILEEAQDFAPQHAQGGVTARLVGAVADVVRLGRSFGLGVMLITQRPQSVSKEVLNQVECLMVGQIQGKHERDAIKGWIGEKGGPLDAANSATRAALDGLPYLDPGDFYLWSPQWLKTFQKVRPFAKRTFDASATPELDDAAPPMPALDAGDVDFSALRAVLAKPVAEFAEGPRPSDAAPGTDVAKLRAELSTVAEDLMRAQADQANLTLALRKREQMLAEIRQSWCSISAPLHAALGAMQALAAQLDAISPLDEMVDFDPPCPGERIAQTPARFDALPANDMPPPSMAQKLETARRITRGIQALAAEDRERMFPSVEFTSIPVKAEPGQHRIKAPGTGKVPGTITRTVSRDGPGIKVDVELGKCARAILGAVTALGSMSRLRAAVLTGYAYQGGGFRNAISELRTAGLIGDGAELAATVCEWQGELPQPARGGALVALWNAELGACAREILRVLLTRWEPQRSTMFFPRDDVARLTRNADGEPYQSSGGGFRNAISELRVVGLILTGDGGMKINPEIVSDLRGRTR